ncbi:MAG: type II toxin-antitoxin system RelE/ParE family toxin [Armatimonadota bacterium]|nr:type II toxin-antitoxin system RelE/ParE family toxin [Armatimonadota bacterium]
MLERELIEDGFGFVVVALRTREGHPTLYDEFVQDELREDEQQKIDYAVRRMAHYGPPRNPEKGHPVTNHRNLYVLKEHQTRVFWFYTGENLKGKGIIALTHGFRKKRDKPPPQEIQRAENLKARYAEEFLTK